jgi:hypothetical protein
MDLKRRLVEIADFLQPYQRIWQNEIMLQYPNPIQDFPEDWVEELARIRDPKEVVRLEKKEVESLITHPDLLAFYRRIEELSKLPSAPELPAMPENAFTFLYVIPKKQHEIRRLAPYVNHFYYQHGVEKVVDIGGGIGILAQTLCNQYNLKVMTLDMDPELQKTGRKRHEKNFVHPDNQVSFHLVKVSEDEPKFKELLRPNMMTVGLHACGPLSLDQLKATARAGAKGLLNFGCCYYKLSKCEGTQNISAFAQALPQKVEQSPYCLTLATRAHKKMNEADYHFKVKVKHYRYMMHFLLHDHYDRADLTTLGNTHHRLYEKNFSDYALEQFRRIGVTPNHSADELDLFFADPHRQAMVWKMLAAGLIRNALGRLLEIYLLLDRAIYLEEQGYQAELLEFFDESLSPRNIGIAAFKP